MKTLAFVIPWYHENIGGGAEVALRQLAGHLQAAGVDLEILTTCVRDFSADWNVNYFQPGDDICGGIRVKRFPVRERDVAAFDRVNYRLINALPISPEEEEIFVREMINSPALYQYIREHQSQYALFVFTPYMFGTTYYGVQECYQKAVMIPCFHGETYAYMDVFKRVFPKVAGMIFLSDEERKLAESVYGVSGENFRTLGTGLKTDFTCNAERFRAAYQIYSPFILYAGRKEAGKRVDELMSHFVEFKRRNPSDLKLVLIGGGEIEIPSDEIIDLGFLDEQDKFDAYAAADIFCNPSEMESFSLVLMESWLAETPVLVNARCDVTTEFARSANAGLYYENFEEFEGCAQYLLTHRDIARQMGRNGRQYVLSHFSWDSVVRRYCDYFRMIATGQEGGGRETSFYREASPKASGAEDGRKGKIAFVCQRYGEEVNGGAEAYCRTYAERLCGAYDVEVYTSCAIDYVTWANEYPAGRETLHGVTVRRFPTTRTRDNDSFNAFHSYIITAPNHTDAEEWRWVDAQGPVCPALTDALKRNYRQYKAVIFVTYLYYTSVRGLLLDLPNAILIPTVHDEPPVYLRCYDSVFRAAKGFIWNTPEERAFAERRFPDIIGRPGILTGIGVETPPEDSLPPLPENLQGVPYILYAGRIEEAKGCKEMFEYFLNYCREYPGRLKLVLIGKPVIPIPESQDIINLGFVSEEMKYAIMRGAKALTLFSHFESLSIVVLESMAMGRPVIVNQACEVLKGHCDRSGAGLYFGNYGEFAERLNRLLSNPEMCRSMRENAKAYVAKNYRWDDILSRIQTFIQKIGGLT